MIVVAYLLPVAAILLMFFEFDLRDPWWPYVVVGVAGELTAVLCHRAFLRKNSRFYEYHGSLVDTVQFEDSWTEVRHETQTYKDSRGRTQTRTVTRYIYHPERYTILTSTAECIVTTDDYYRYIGMRWGIEPEPDSWYSTRIRGHWRYGSHYSFADLQAVRQTDWSDWVPVSTSHPYKNKIRAAGSNSIFKFFVPDESAIGQYGLVDYPGVCMHDSPAILSQDIVVPEAADAMMRAFNGRFGAERQIRLYVILFDSRKHGIESAEMQRAYWQGGNKNEFVVCMGVDPATDTVTWARAFSWADEQTCEVEAAAWLMKHRQLDWKAFFDYMVEATAGWKRKEFSDFDYIRVSLSLGQILWTYFICAAVSAALIWGTIYALQEGYIH